MGAGEHGGRSDRGAAERSAGVREWSSAAGSVVLVRYADDLVLLAPNAVENERAWTRLMAEVAALGLTINEAKSQLTTARAGFCFLGFAFRERYGRLYLRPHTKAVGRIVDRVRAAVRSECRALRAWTT